MAKIAKPQPLQEIEALRARIADLDRALAERDRELAELRADHNKLSLVLENVDRVFWILTPDLSRFIYISPAYERISGRSCRSLYEDARSWFDSIHPEDRDLVFNVASRRVRGEAVGVDTIVFRIFRPDGSMRWIRGRGFLVRGDPNYYVGFGEDITDRKAAEETAAEQAEQLRMITDQMPAVLWSTDTELRITSSSGAGLAELGMNPGETNGMTLQELVQGDDKPAVVAHRQALNGQAVRYEDKFGDRVFDAHVEPLRDDQGRITGVLGLALDITERTRAEEALRQAHDELEGRVEERTTQLSVAKQKLEREMVERERAEESVKKSEELYRLVAEHSTDMISRHAMDGTYLYASPACRSLLGYEPEEMIGVNPYDLFHPDDIAAVEVSHKTISREPVDYKVEYRIRRKDGDYTWFETISKSILDPKSGELKDIICVSRDITQRKQAEERAGQLQSDLAHMGRVTTIGQMASGLAHEINQPLAAVSTYVDACRRLMQNSECTPTEVIEALDEIGGEARRASTVIQKLREFLRRPDPEDSLIVANDLVREVVDLTSAQIRGTGSTLHLDLADDLPPVYVDSIQIQQVILNLVRNSLEAMETTEEGQRVLTITTRQIDKSGVEFEVSDTGCGISEGVQSRLFEPFYTTKEKGMGLGLVISRTIIQAHGGDLWSIPQPDRGANFRFTLPTGPEGKSNAGRTNRVRRG
jgi:PAS domain S-box-containing protein